MRRSRTAEGGHVDGAGTVVGDVVDGYGIVRRVRVRGCAAVYKAVKDGEEVALKTLCRGAVPQDQSRMDNELASLRALADCPHTPRLRATGSCGPQRYFAMNWLPGPSLRRLTTTVGGDASDVFAAVAVPVCEAYDELHRRGVTHGDVSRHNILIDPGDGLDADPEPGRGVGLVDFESSARTVERDRGRPRPRITWTYAGPEFASDGADAPVPTPASDQYAVAAVLYRQLAGRHHRPKPDGDKPDSPAALGARVRPVTGWAARRWPGLPEVFETALRRDPRERYPNMAEFAAALGAALASVADE